MLYCVALILVSAAGTKEDEAPGPLFFVGFLGIVVCLAWQCKSYRCPECGDRLKMILVGRQGGGDKGPIHHDCPRCNLEWDAGDEWYADNSD
jgi:hypothetical protein